MKIATGERRAVLQPGGRSEGLWGGSTGLGYLAELGPRPRHNQTHSNLLCPSSVTEASEHLRQKGPVRLAQAPVETRADPRASQELWLLTESSNFA